MKTNRLTYDNLIDSDDVLLYTPLKGRYELFSEELFYDKNLIVIQKAIHFALEHFIFVSKTDKNLQLKFDEDDLLDINYETSKDILLLDYLQDNINLQFQNVSGYTNFWCSSIYVDSSVEKHVLMDFCTNLKVIDIYDPKYIEKYNSHESYETQTIKLLQDYHIFNDKQLEIINLIY